MPITVCHWGPALQLACVRHVPRLGGVAGGARLTLVHGAAGVPLMTHHSFSTVGLDLCPGADASEIKLRKGDIYTHTYHGFETTLVDIEGSNAGKISPWA